MLFHDNNQMICILLNIMRAKMVFYVISLPFILLLAVDEKVIAFLNAG